MYSFRRICFFMFEGCKSSVFQQHEINQVDLVMISKPTGLFVSAVAIQLCLCASSEDACLIGIRWSMFFFIAKTFFIRRNNSAFAFHNSNFHKKTAHHNSNECCDVTGKLDLPPLREVNDFSNRPRIRAFWPGRPCGALPMEWNGQKFPP